MSLHTYQNHVDTRTGTTPPKPDELSELDKLQKKLGGPFKKLAGIVGASIAPVPTGTGDGSKLQPEPTDESLFMKRIENDLRDFSRLGITDYNTLIEIFLKKLAGEPQDDKEYLMEALIRTAAHLPDGSRNRDKLTGEFLTQLWNDLEHPPLSYLGSQYQYRSADGSFNSLVHPQLGAAGTPYARTVKPSMMQTPCRPDAGVVFDSVMTRKHAEKHPNEISSVLFYLASIIIHDCFRTDHRDYSNSLTSSYLDLSPLYGSNQDEQNLMRTFVDGKIKPDAFSEQRLLFFPPGVGCLLVMFNRFHNHVVSNLALINEGNRFAKPVAPSDPSDEKKSETYKAALAKYDNDLFQTGRLVTCGLYVNIILIDYVRTILNLNRTDSNWQLNPRADIKDLPIGVGNQVSAEFNLVYRWHSTMSTRDEEWTQELWDGLFGKGRDPKTVEPREFLMKLNEVYQKAEKDPGKRTFAKLQRGEDGRIPDQALVDILVSSVEDCANSFGPNRVPAVMRAIEVLGIEQSRAWNLGSLNEFRKYFGLEPHTSFEDITSDKYVAEQLKHLYDHPDKVEIYPGLVVEDAKKAMAPGSGLTPSYTVSRAVLSDAVALVRGDRFYTRDYNPRTLTNWGYAQADSDTAVDNGCVFYKLFLTAFPQHFASNSVYVHYPLTVPSAMKTALSDPTVDKAHLYDFARPVFTPKPRVVSSYADVSAILKDQDAFKPTWGKALAALMGDPARDLMLTGDGSKNSTARDLMSNALYVPDWEKQVRAYYAGKTAELLASKSATIAGFHQVDIVRDVGNLAHVHFVSELFQLPLKTAASPRGIFSEAEMYLLLSGALAQAAAGGAVVDTDPASAFALRVSSRHELAVLADYIEANLAFVASSGALSALVRTVWPPADSPLPSYGLPFLQRLLASRIPPRDLVYAHILRTAAATVSTLGKLFAQILEFFLRGAGAPHWPAVQRLAAKHPDDDAAFDALARYVLEAGRIAGETAVLREAVVGADDSTTTTTLPAPEHNRAEHTPPLAKSSTTTLLLDLHAASRDAAAFPDPLKLDTTRPLTAYVHLGGSGSGSSSDTAPLATIALTAMLREVARLAHVRPAAGAQGWVHGVRRDAGGNEGGDEGGSAGQQVFLTEMWDGFWGVPCAFKVNWDA